MYGTYMCCKKFQIMLENCIKVITKDYLLLDVDKNLCN